MSSHDGSGTGEDVFYPTVIENNNYNVYGNVDMPHLLAGQQHQQQHGQQQQQQWWQPGHMLGQPFLQHPPPPPPPHHQQHQPQHHPLHPQQQQQQPQQAPFNEYFNFNMHAPYAAAAGPSETYSVLPVGHGNFLKVYHCPENANVAMPSDPASAAALYRHHQNQQLQQQQQQHQQHAFPPMAFQNMAQQQLQHHQHQQQQQQQPPAPQQQQQQQPTSSPPMHDFNSYELFSSNTIIPTPECPPLEPTAPLTKTQQPQGPLTSPTPTTTQTTNMIINKLVNNWSPSLTSGTYSQFGSPLVANPMEDTPITEGLSPVDRNADVNISEDVTHTANNKNTTVEASLLATATTANAIKAHGIKDITATLPKLTPVSPPSKASSTSEVKKRIVAEVKPMRMTYSDVLSKLNSQEQEQQQQNFANSAGAGQQMNTGNKQQQQQQLPQKNNQGKSTAGERTKETGVPRKQQVTTEESGNGRPATTTTTTVNAAKKSPTHENSKELGQAKVNSNSNLNNNTNKSRNQQKPQNGKTTIPTVTQNKPSSAAADANGQTKKRSLNGKRGEASERDADGRNPKLDKDFNAVYNVTAATKHTENADKSTKGNGNQQSTCNSRGKQSKQSYSNAGSNGSRSRYGNWNVGASTSSYSSKRGSRHNNLAAATASSTNRNYELAKKILHAWFEYTVKILVWLYYLVYDIVVIGCSMAFERLSHGYANGMVYAKQWRKELQQNSNKPGLWLKDLWRRFDGRFHKTSKWAVWRRFYRKKNTATDSSHSTESSKQGGGRLPQTGEEAMYSLLNCKGKDAYSILGVPPNSSQEQIRKHYKKIAVLVHPDKNKQAGAEEAFKVLQRAFELIGEPENRVAYDQSLAEALHAEKAWTELHDLLSQLQTKITEAANTIRCSTCGLRHPRKLTERPHYAARECASCKIRHSAREGDIWAETSCLGLRWKYLALMEGKVYDITEWANCQKGALSHLEPNSHVVQYRIVRGAQQQQQQQQQQQNQHQRQQANHQQQHQQHHSPHHDDGRNGVGGSSKYKRDIPPSEASLHEFLDNLYSGQNPKQPNANAFNQSGATSSTSSRRRSRRN